MGTWMWEIIEKPLYIFTPTELVVLRRQRCFPHPPQAANSVGVSFLTQLHIDRPAVCRLPQQNDKGGATPRINPANAMATWSVGMQECGTAITH